MREKTLTVALFVAVGLVLLFSHGVSSKPVRPALAQGTTPTSTTVPSTDTPVPPTDTPVPPTATATPASPTPTSTPIAALVNIALAANSVGCSGQIQVTVSATTPSGGPVPDGTPVTLSTSLGIITPTSGTTQGGGLFALFVAPASSGGTATLTVTVDGATAAANISVLCPTSAAVLGFPTTQCVNFPPTSVNVTFTFQPAAGALVQWLDLSLFDNGFVPGTFLGAGPLTPDGTTVVWQGLRPGLPHFWRVNALTPGGWVTSTTGAFVPCGAPALRTTALTYACTGNGRADVTFRWAAGAPAGLLQFLDLTLFDNGFVPGTFLGAGPLSPTAQELTWRGLLANTVHFWRVNSLIFGWNASLTGSFVAVC